MGRLQRTSIYAVIYILIVSALAASDFPRIEPSPWAVTVGIQRTPLTVPQLIDAALHASGLGPEELPRYRSRIARLLQPLTGYIKERPADVPPGEAVLYYLHERLFTRYLEPQTLINVTLDTGNYNCVSSAVIYAIAARHAGMPVRGVVTPDHAFCRVIEDGVGTDVETTNPYGYNPGQKREFTNAFGQTGFTYVPPGKYHLRTDIDEKELIGLILQNRISRLQRQNRIDLAVPLAVDRYAMTGTERIKAELIKEFINYISVLNGERRFNEAFAFLDMVRLRWGNNDEYADILDTLLYNAAVIASREGRGEERLTLLRSRYEKGDLGKDDYQQYRQIVGEGLIFKYSNEHAPADSLVELEKLRSLGLLSDSTYNDYRGILQIRHAKAVAENQGDLAALEYLKEQELHTSADPRIQQALDIFTHNAAAFYHNRFVSLFQEKRYSEAERIIQEGLQYLSGNALLQRDRQILNQAQKQ